MLKFSAVTPVHKSDELTNVSNYRPISIQSYISKIFESLVLHSIQPSINRILMEEQHGFRPGRSTITCNLVFHNYVYYSFNLKSQVDVIYTDFNKAFDSVNHKALVQDLNVSGIGEPLLSWFSSYLSHRYKWVNLFGVKSNIYLATSGVPQGGHLSPLLFSLFINSVPSVLSNSRILSFADDIDLSLVYRPSMIVFCYSVILIGSLSGLIS
jgi:retron-type reverse transcriptase